MSAEEIDEGSGTLQMFFTLFAVLPLAAWGGYTLIRDLLDEDAQPAPRPVRPRRRQVVVVESEPEEEQGSYVQEEAAVDGEAADGEAGVEAAGDGDAEAEEAPEPKEPPPPPIHPEILYAQSVELTDYLEGAECSPQTAFVIEDTPVGLVAMGYDFGEKRWIYWANLTPHFRVLDAVARAYANAHNRHPLYIPPSVADAANGEDEKVEGAKEIAADAKASLFVTPTPSDATEPTRPEQRHIANSFKRQGMLNELRFIPEGPRDQPKQVSYSDFPGKRESGWVAVPSRKRALIES